MVDDRHGEAAADLVARSSLGSPDASRLRSLTDDAVVRQVVGALDPEPDCGHTWSTGLDERCDVCLRFVLQQAVRFARQGGRSPSGAVNLAHEVFEPLLCGDGFASLRSPHDVRELVVAAASQRARRVAMGWLTPATLAVLGLVYEGWTVSEVATRLDMALDEVQQRFIAAHAVASLLPREDLEALLAGGSTLGELDSPVGDDVLLDLGGAGAD